MIYHVLNGDALIDRFIATAIPGEITVARECLIDGELHGDTLPDFWKSRALYLEGAFQAEKETYFKNAVSEFNKLLAAPDNSEFNLWFGYDLFCRANMWFVISLLQSMPVQKKVFVVYPSFLAPADIWKDFGSARAEDLKTAFKIALYFQRLISGLVMIYGLLIKTMTLATWKNFLQVARSVFHILKKFAKLILIVSH